jgi:hypothetical protein
MCRVNDLGNYELGNVYIDSFSNNSKLRNRLIPYHSEETKQLIREKRSKQKMSYDHYRSKRKKILTPEGIFPSIKEAADYFCITPEAISYRCRTKKEYRLL